jgi:hypothetical protein
MRPIAQTILVGSLGILLLVGPLGAADEPKSGPQTGASIPGPLQSLNVTGDRANKFHCLVCQYGLGPAVLIFAREAPKEDSPFATLVKKLDAIAQKYADYRVGTSIIILTDTKDAELAGLEKQLKELAEKLEIKQLVFSVISTNSELKEFGPAQENLKTYAISPDADLTVLIYRRHKVTANYAFGKDKLTDKDVDAILADVTKILPQKKEAGRTTG